MIRDIAALREHGQVSRRVVDLDVDVETWRASIRQTARREGMRIRTFLVPPPSTAPGSATEQSVEGPGADHTAEGGAIVCAVRTDLPPDKTATIIAMDTVARHTIKPAADVPPPTSPATLLSFTDARARLLRHPSLDPQHDN